jgi:hypothetical protein
MLYTVEHQKIESTIAGPYSVVVFRHHGPRLDRATAVIVSSATGLATPELCDRRAIEYAETFQAKIVNPLLSEKYALIHKERLLSPQEVVAHVCACGESCSVGSIGYYRSIDMLAAKVRSSRHWAYGETFVWAASPEQYLVLSQIAPDSCELMAVTPAGIKDVVTGYRFSQEDLVQQLLAPAGARQKLVAASSLKRLGPKECCATCTSDSSTGFLWRRANWTACSRRPKGNSTKQRGFRW